MEDSQAVETKEATQLIEEDIRHLIGLMGFDEVKVRCRIEEEENTLHASIEAGDSGRLLIGTRGNHLHALQHIIRCVLRRRMEHDFRTVVDVNQYKFRREQSLLRLAEQTAKKAQQTGRTIVMDAMTASDRRAIHTALANNKNVKTESLGDEPNRRVVVKPIFL